MSTEAVSSWYAHPADCSGKAFYYARTPMMLVDIHGIITDLNAACRELLGSDVAGCRGQHYIYLVNRLRTKIEGEVLPPQGLATSYFRTQGDKAARTSAPVLETADLNLAVIESHYHSSRFGRARLRISELPRIDTATGACAGSLIFLEPCDVAEFQVAVDRRLSHEVMWEVYASSYDRILSEMPFYEEVVERHCTAMQPAEIHTVLDVGAGTGIPTLRFVDLGKQVTAVEINRAMLQKLRSKLSPEHAAQMNVLEDTAEQLPQLQDASFDGVSVLLAFFDMNDPHSALMESLRVLRPGGTLIVTEPRACFNVDELMAAAEQSLRAKGLLERLAVDWQRIQTVAPLIRDTVRDIQSRSTVTPVEQGWHAEAVRDILNRENFVNLTFRESHLGNCATILGQKPSES